MWMDSGSASSNGPCLAKGASRSSLLYESKSESSAKGSALASDPLLSVQAKSRLTDGSPIRDTLTKLIAKQRKKKRKKPETNYMQETKHRKAEKGKTTTE